MRNNLFDLLLAAVRNEMTSCLNCQPYEDGSPVWIDDAICLDDLFDELHVPESMRSSLTRQLRCRTCGNRFEQYDTVGVELRCRIDSGAPLVVAAWCGAAVSSRVVKPNNCLGGLR
jgi:hypothetical protein